MKNSPDLFEHLQSDIRLLENTLAVFADQDHIWPGADMDTDALHEFAEDLHRLAWECLAIAGRRDMPPYLAYDTEHLWTTDYGVLIRLTRTWVQNCDENLIREYRDLTIAEDQTITLLQQLHSAMIGHVYFRHPGMESIPAHEMRFYS
ncbi:hypothetical protein [Mucilaginibacter paludis]|uniref:Uncharacterized protein n=1 Tax=Mucilaginibacter paludis DSM 18603 TaxID=714943 RepID=H1Y148_9SPHI|nr:hypothetical protein [Mucilaginibacter paludis]EHQ29683.1 hypothetical protein Mucpa_5614 [Mucilaginibacter paludis DSM 18603]